MRRKFLSLQLLAVIKAASRLTAGYFVSVCASITPRTGYLIDSMTKNDTSGIYAVGVILAYSAAVRISVTWLLSVNGK
jgi:hypothetical protein